MRDRLSGVVNKFRHLCDYMEIRVEDYGTTNISINTDVTETIGVSIDMGGSVRALVKGGWGFTSFNDMNLLEDFAVKAIEQAKRVGRRKSLLAPVPVITDDVRVKPLVDPGGITLKEKKKLLDVYNEIILNYDRKRIQNSMISYYEQFKKKYFVNSEETFIEQEFLDLYILIEAIAKKEGVIQNIPIGRGSSDNFNVCKGLEEKVEEACRIAVLHLQAPKVKGGTYTVIYDQELTGLFAHESFGHSCEADFYKDESMKNELSPGRVVGSKVLNIYDTGLDVGTRGYVKYDDEGVRTEKTCLIKDGVLVGRLHSRETASIQNEKPTGSARAVNYKFPPLCRMRNTCVEGGKSTFKDMMKDIKTGIYAMGSQGGSGRGEMFTMVPSYCYMIRDGELTEPVRDVKITGNLFETLKNIDMIGSDFEIRDTYGGCGKFGHYPLPTTYSAPHIRIQNVTVGGGA